jgi:uncharacterized membrane protein
MSTSSKTHQSPVAVGADVVEVAGVGVRTLEIGLVVLIGLLVTPPLTILAVLVAVPIVVVAAIVGVIAGPIALVRHVRAHHRAHGSTVFLHRLRPWPRSR